MLSGRGSDVHRCHQGYRRCLRRGRSGYQDQHQVTRSPGSVRGPAAGYQHQQQRHRRHQVATERVHRPRRHQATDATRSPGHQCDQHPPGPAPPMPPDATRPPGHATRPPGRHQVISATMLTDATNATPPRYQDVATRPPGFHQVATKPPPDATRTPPGHQVTLTPPPPPSTGPNQSPAAATDVTGPSPSPPGTPPSPPPARRRPVLYQSPPGRHQATRINQDQATRTPPVRSTPLGHQATRPPSYQVHQATRLRDQVS